MTRTNEETQDKAQPDFEKFATEIEKFQNIPSIKDSQAVIKQLDAVSS